jgi:hypothetical protein
MTDTQKMEALLDAINDRATATLPQATTQIIGEVGVDTAHLLIIDPSYLLDPEMLASVLDQLRAYRDQIITGHAGDFTQLHYPMGHAGMGVVFRTGIGDGTYPVQATVIPSPLNPPPETAIASVTIPFLPYRYTKE